MEKEFWRTSSKIMVTVMLCASILAASIGGMVLYQSSKVIEENTFKNLKTMAENYANTFSKSTEQVETTLASYLSSINATFDFEAFQRDPDSYLKFYQDYTLVPLTKQFAIDNKEDILGIYFDFDPSLPKNLDYNEQTYGVWYLDKNLNGNIDRKDMELKKNFYPENANMSWYYDAVRAGTGVWSKPYIDIYTGYYMISYTVPLYNQKQLIGVAGIDMTFESVKSIIEKFNVLDTGYAFLLSSDYNVIVSPKLKEFNKNIKLTDLNEEYQELIDVIESDTSIYGNSKYDESKKVMIGKSYDANVLSYGKMTNGYIFIIEVKSDEIFKDLNYVRMLIDIMILFGIIICAVVAYLLGRYIAKPVEEAQKKIRRLSNMDFQKDSSNIKIYHNKEGQKLLDEIEQIRSTTERFILTLRENLNQDEIVHEKLQSTISKLEVVLGRLEQNPELDKSGYLREFQLEESRKLLEQMDQLLNKLRIMHKKNKKLGGVFFIDEKYN